MARNAKSGNGLLESFGATLVLAPHPDDETLGCGATLLRLRSETPHPRFWVLMTRMSEEAGYSMESISKRQQEIGRISSAYGFSSTVQLPFDAATLDAVPLNKMVKELAEVFDELRPATVLLPHPADAHSDHRRCFAVGSACLKWFRREHLCRVMSYEVLSETGFNLDPSLKAFAPNCYIRVSPEFIEKKVQIMNDYETEMRPFPFPRSPEAIRSLASLRGSECGAPAAEAFVTLREIL